MKTRSQELLIFDRPWDHLVYLKKEGERGWIKGDFIDCELVYTWITFVRLLLSEESEITCNSFEKQFRSLIRLSAFETHADIKIKFRIKNENDA